MSMGWIIIAFGAAILIIFSFIGISAMYSMDNFCKETFGANATSNLIGTEVGTCRTIQGNYAVEVKIVKINNTWLVVKND